MPVRKHVTEDTGGAVAGTSRRRSGRISSAPKKSSYWESADSESDDEKPVKKKAKVKNSGSRVKQKQDSDEDEYTAEAQLAAEAEEEEEEEEEEDEEEDDENRKMKVTIVPLEKLRDDGGVPYEDHKVHGNTLLFLKDLKANNRRPWLKSHDGEYRRAFKDWTTFVDLTTQTVSDADATIPELPSKDVVFRIYRDTRFSKDPTPYKPHFSVAWSRTGRKGPYACYYVHLEPGRGKSFIGGGLWHPEAAHVQKMRRSIDRHPERWRAVLGEERFRRVFFPGVDGKKGVEAVVKAFVGKNQMNALKKKPMGYDATHRDIELLRLKNYTVGIPFDEEIFYSGQLDDTVASIISSLPPSPTVDRLLSRYLNDLDIAPGVVHSGQFLAEYEEFWRAPESASVAWVGLLFSIICLSTHLQQTCPTQPGHEGKGSQLSEKNRLIDLYKSQSIKCLILCRWTEGGPHVLETLILYFLVECFHLQDMQIGTWVLVGNIVQIAIHMGYHRDAKHFPSISPFVGEMRRRVWAMILQLDFGVSWQLGLPRLVREQHADTEKPSNLYDMDFDLSTLILPASRSETDVTPTLFVLAKLRLLDVGAKVADLATEPRPRAYSDILKLDQEIDKAQDKLPPIFKWTGLALNVSSQIMIQRIWLEVICQQLRIVLHKKYLSLLQPQQQFRHSRSTCLNAAMKILELQRLIDQETQTDGLWYQSRWRVSSAFNNDFLLATSVLCFYLKTYDKMPKESLDDNPVDVTEELTDFDSIKKSLQQAQEIWTRQCADSKEAKKAVAALHHVLGPTGVNSQLQSDCDTQDISGHSFLSTRASSHFSGFDFSDATFDSVDGFNWQGFAADLIPSNEHWAGVGNL